MLLDEFGEKFTDVKKENELIEPVQNKANDAVNKVAKANGYIAVFNTSIPSLAYFDEAQLTDIAALVKKELGIVEKPAAAPAK